MWLVFVGLLGLCFLFDNDRNSFLSFWHSLSNQASLAVSFLHL